MRKQLLPVLRGLLIGLLISSPALAQINAGLKGGFNLSNARWSTANALVKPILKVGLHGGVFVEIPLNENWFLKPELLFSVKGWTNPAVERDSFNVKSSSEQLIYLSLPLLGGYRLSPRIAVLAGPEISLLTKDRTIPGSFDTNRIYHSQDLGLAIGAVYNVADKFKMEARYVYGLTSLSDVVDKSGRRVKDGYNRLLQLSLGYMIFQQATE